ncbi:MAG: hypothetical protein M0P13_08205 [Fibrobacteraceae bacterium]|nr:hypothetical protein [Fibrobacteraceae bacterium]
MPRGFSTWAVPFGPGLYSTKAAKQHGCRQVEPSLRMEFSDAFLAESSHIRVSIPTAVRTVCATDSGDICPIGDKPATNRR